MLNQFVLMYLFWLINGRSSRESFPGIFCSGLIHVNCCRILVEIYKIYDRIEWSCIAFMCWWIRSYIYLQQLSVCYVCRSRFMSLYLYFFFFFNISFLRHWSLFSRSWDKICGKQHYSWHREKSFFFFFWIEKQN